MRPPLLQTKLDFTVPSTPGQHTLTLYFMCDSWMGCDQVRGGRGLMSPAHPPGLLRAAHVLAACLHDTSWLRRFRVQSAHPSLVPPRPHPPSWLQEYEIQLKVGGEAMQE